MSTTSPLEVARSDAAECTRCDLHRSATATVWGEGPPDARLLIVGEQPGDQEDRAGRPFVGPAGQLLDRALVEAGIDRTAVYVTNAVKHFKWEPRGTRRLHKSPDQTEVVACRVWLEAEAAGVRPSLAVALGAIAGRALFGPKYRVGAQRGRIVTATVGAWSGDAMGTIHPSAILRRATPDERETEFAALVADLGTAVAHLDRPAPDGAGEGVSPDVGVDRPLF